MSTTTKLVTYQDWLEMPAADDVIQEVVNGEIVTMPPPKARHADVVEALAEVLKRQTDPRNTRVRVSMFGLVISTDPLVMRIPDLAVFHNSNVIVRDGYIHSAPELIVEVLSPANHRADREAKLRDYQALGVPEIWVVSPEARTFETLLLVGGKLTTTATLREGILHPARFPEVAVDISSIWPE
jgi:Uma2 family endonuclease